MSPSSAANEGNDMHLPPDTDVTMLMVGISCLLAAVLLAMWWF